MYKATLQPYDCAQINARRVHIKRAVQYHSRRKKRHDAKPFHNGCWRPNDNLDPNNPAHFNTRVA